MHHVLTEQIRVESWRDVKLNRETGVSEHGEIGYQSICLLSSWRIWSESFVNISLCSISWTKSSIPSTKFRRSFWFQSPDTLRERRTLQEGNGHDGARDQETWMGCHLGRERGTQDIYDELFRYWQDNGDVVEVRLRRREGRLFQIIL